jgi:hypothetical protein
MKRYLSCLMMDGFWRALRTIHSGVLIKSKCYINQLKIVKLNANNFVTINKNNPSNLDLCYVTGNYDLVAKNYKIYLSK